MELPPKAEFYARRDDRTNSRTETPQYQKASLLIAGEEDVLETYAGRVLARTTTNLVSRFGRDVNLAFPSAAPDLEVPQEGNTLAEQCIRQMQAADPYGRFECIAEPGEREYDCAITIGNPDMAITSAPSIRADGGGWMAHVVRSDSVDRPNQRGPNPIGPITAACLAVAEAFKTVNGASEQQLSGEIIYDVFRHEARDTTKAADHPVMPDSLELGTVRMVGVGSVGSAAAHFIGRLPIKGELQLVDHDTVELVNLNRTPLFQVDHALDGRKKTEVGEEYLNRVGIEASAYALPYDQFESQSVERPDVVLPLANERNVRSAIQRNRPPVMLHATTSGAQVSIRRHIPIDEPCLLCHFPPDNPQIDPGCAVTPVSSGDDDSDADAVADAALPFASYLAGCFVAAELAKLPLDAYPPTDNLARIQLLTDLGEGGVLQYPKDRAEDCVFCSNSSPSIHAGRIDGTQFDYLTDTNP